MFLKYNGHNTPVAKTLRKNATRQENHLWYDFLSKYPLARFQRQKPIDNFIVDFYCHNAKLAIEVDGSQHNTEIGQHNDQIRTEVLENYGLTVVRIPNRLVDREFDRVCDFIDSTIQQMLKTPHNGV